MENLIAILKLKGGSLCVKDTQLKVSIGEKYSDESVKKQFAASKEEIIQLLLLNDINTYDKFKSKRFFKTNNRTYPLYFSQERLLFIDQYEEGCSAYNIPLLFELKQAEYLGTFLRCVESIADRHTILRTIYSQNAEGRYEQRISDQEIYHTHIQVEHDELESKITNDIQTVIDLKAEIPLKIYSYALNDKVYVLVIIHHIAFDGWSMSIFKRALLTFFEHFNDNSSIDLPELEIQYQDYSLWQRFYFENSELEDKLQDLSRRFSGEERLYLPFDNRGSNHTDYCGDHIRFDVSAEISKKLRLLANEHECSLHDLLLTSFYVLLKVYSQQNEIVIGVPFANRGHLQTENLIGYFINTLPVKIDIGEKETVLSLLLQVQKTMVELQSCQEVSFEKIVESLDIEADPAIHPLFQVMFTMQSEDVRSDNCYFKELDTLNYFKFSKFDLSLNISATNSQLQGVLTYSSSLFEKETIGRMMNHYLTILDIVTTSQNASVQTLNVLSAKEQQLILRDWNMTQRKYPERSTIDQLFEEQAVKTPNAIAVVFDGKKITYNELNEKSNQLARYIKQTIPEDSRNVCLCFDRSLEMVIAILGVLKAGLTYVPIDPSSPIERAKHIQRDTDSALVLSKDNFCINGQDTSNLKRSHNSNSLAYILYTSGSTGKPKGVMVKHQSVVNTISSLDRVYDFSDESRRVTLFSSYVFDVSVSEIFVTLCNGAELHILNEETIRDAQLFSNYINDNSINYAYIPPAVLSVLPRLKYPSLKTVIFAGEPCPQGVGEYWAGQTKLYNYYGPTEATIYATGTLTDHKNMNVIGRPIFNNHAFVFDKHLNPVPIGVKGELYIGGVGVSDGYLNQPELTNQSFIQKNERLYKTGDLVRWLPDGQLEYLGRNDTQIKIRGYRVELEEISNVVLELPSVRQCIVIHQSKGQNVHCLICYYASENELDKKVLERHIRSFLPNYMMPHVFVHMESLPLNASGKLNRRALPKPDFDVHVSSPPKNDTEKALCELWKELLHIDHVGVDDDFFKLGGSSLLAMQLAFKMSHILQKNVTVSSIFTYKTISSILSSVQPEKVRIPLSSSSDTPLTEAQERLFFIEQYEKGSHAYNIPILYKVCDATTMERMVSAIEVICDRHEILKSRFTQSQRIVYFDRPLHVTHRHITIDSLHETVSGDAMKPFQLESEAPIKVYKYTTDSENYILVNIHHIAFDGLSVNILHKELDACLENKVLPSLPIQYRDYAKWSRCQPFEDEPYYQNKLKQCEPLTLPLDKVRPNQIDYSGEYLPFEIDSETSHLLRAYAKKIGVAPHTLMVAAFSILLHRLSNQQDIVIGIPVSNRPNDETKDLIGLFVNTLACKVGVDPEHTLEDLINSVDKELIETYEHSDVSFEKLLKALDLEKNPSIHPVIQVMLSIQNTVESPNNPDYELLPVENYYKVSKFDLSLFLDDRQESIKGTFNYATSLFNADSIERMIEHFLQIISAIVKTPELQLQDLPSLTAAEESVIIDQCNNTKEAFREDQSLYDLFENHSRSSDTAVIDEEGSYSYEWIYDFSQSLAKKVHEQGAQKNQLIAILSEKGHKQVVSALGILRAGAAYLPLHIEWPVDRIDEVLKEGKVEQVLVSREQWNLIQKTDIAQKYLYTIIEDIRPEKESLHFNKPDPEDIAYVIFTSGSTGKPKGVTISHSSAANTIYAVNDRFSVGKNDSVLAVSDLSFDLSVYDIFGLLAVGGTVVFPEQNQSKDPEHLYRLVAQHSISIWDTVPQLMQVLVDYANETHRVLDTFKVVLMSGDWIPIHLPAQIKKHNKKTIVMSLGGATEGSIWSIWYEVDAVKPQWSSIPYGKAMPNQNMYVLNEQGQHCPFGVIGEIHIGGKGVAMGYWGDLEKTERSFFCHPTLGRLYRTGDLGKWNRQGYIEFQGRKDGQIKRNGYRLELGEVALKCIGYRGIDKAIALMKSQNDLPVLIVYYCAENSIDDGELIDFLQTKLPNYMIPDQTVFVKNFQLTSNGKIDSSALTVPEIPCSFVAPSNEIETDLCTIWKSVLRRERIGIHDDFFRLGGDSILSIQIVSKIRQKGYQCDVRDIFNHRTVEKLSKHLTKRSKDFTTVSETGNLEGEFPLLPIQQWFFERKWKFPNHWNQSFCIEVSDLDIDILHSAIAKLAEYHDILRVTFNGKGQRYHSSIKVPDILEIQSMDECHLLQEHLDVENGPLWRIGYIRGDQSVKDKILFVAHHLIIDAVSWSILRDDLKALYQDDLLPEKGSSYRQWVAAVQSYPKLHENERIYWKKQMAEEMPYVIKKCPSHSKITLNKTQTNLLIQHVHHAYNTTVRELLLTAFALSLGKEEVCITLEGHGREPIDPSVDTHRTVGWFTTMYPIKLHTYKKLSQTIKSVKESVKSIPNNGIGYGAFKYFYDEPAINDHTLPTITFNYLGIMHEDSSDWKLVLEGGNKNIHLGNDNPNILEMNGVIADGELQFDIYSRLGDQFADEFKSNLLEIIEHCGKASKQFTPSDFDSVNISQDLIDRLQSDFQIQGIFPASSLQKSFIYYYVTQQGDDAYHIQTLYRYSCPLDLDMYRKAWEQAVEQYPILRTSFNWEEDLIQIVNQSAPLHWKYDDISKEKKQDQLLEEIQREDRKHPFDITKPGLLRIHVIKTGEAEYTVLKSEHHGITDGWSAPILLDKVHENYDLLVNGQAITQFVDTAYLQAQEYQANHRTEVQEYWRQKIQGKAVCNDINAMTSINVDLHTQKKVKTPEELAAVIEGNQYDVMRRFCHKEGITTNVMLQFAWHKLIQTYTNDSRTIVGTTVSGRNLPIEGIENSVGMFINTLPLIVEWNNSDSVVEVLRKIQMEVVDLNEHSYANLAMIQEEGKRLFHTLFIFAGNPQPNADQRAEYRRTVEKLDYPLSIVAFESGSAIHLKFKYDGSIFDQSRIEKLCKQLTSIVTAIPRYAGKIHAELPVMDPVEYSLVVDKWNHTDHEYPQNVTIPEMFEQQVIKSPDSIAAICGEKQLTYSQLNMKSNQLARMIRDLGSPHVVAIIAKRGLHSIIGILGILKSGAAYLPIDPQYPKERIRYILENSNCKLILTQEKFQGEISDVEDMILFEQIGEIAQDTSNVQAVSTPEDLAYIIYTSGTTGKPKGVMVEHRSVLNRIHWMQDVYKLNENDVVLQKTPHTFDVSVWELFWGSWYGCKTVFAEHEGHKDCEYLYRKMIHHKVTVIHFVPPMLMAFVEYCRELNLTLPSSLRLIFCSGDSLTAKHIHAVKSIDKGNRVEIHNLYGPTEATVDVTYFDCNEGMKGSIIGQPIYNTRCYVLNEHLLPVPVNVPGELHISGMCLARGYINNDILTNERFINSTFGRLYKTGDYVRWLENGKLEFLGRKDEQVKMRGYRIELDEVRNIVSQHPEISQCVVTAIKDVSLCCYYVANHEINQQQLESYVRQQLPEYMVPSTFISLDHIPLTSSGKVDKSRLPDPQQQSVEFVPPNTELQKQLCRIWVEVLRIKQVSIHDNFFYIGGNSISAIRVASMINKRLGYNVKVAQIFTCNTIERLSDYLCNHKSYGSDQIIHMMNSFTQLNPTMWLIHSNDGGSEVYQELANTLEGSFNCFGIDNYNMYHDHKISDMRELAGKYIENMRQVSSFTENKVILLGWSSGGRIALEIASKLEKEDVHSIKIYLLDTILPDDYIRMIRQQIREDRDWRFKHSFKRHLLEQHHDEDYVNMIIDAYDAQMTLADQSISTKLQNSDVTLFRANAACFSRHKTKYLETQANHILTRFNNNLSQACDQYTVVNIHCHHFDIIDIVCKYGLDASSYIDKPICESVVQVHGNA